MIATEISRPKMEDHIALVVSLAKRFCPPGMAVVDSVAYADGCVGLAHACKHFDPSKGHKFSSYAVRCIRAAMADGHRKEVKLSDHIEFTPYIEHFIAKPKKDVVDVVELIEDDENGQLFKAHYVDKVSLTKLAKRLGITRQAVQQRVSKVKEKLRAKING